jgi:exosortase
MAFWNRKKGVHLHLSHPGKARGQRQEKGREHRTFGCAVRFEGKLAMKRERSLIFFSILAGLGVTIYLDPLYSLWAGVLNRSGSSHGLFVPFICGYLLWLRLDKIRGIKPKTALLPAGAVMMAGFVFFYFGRSGSGYSLQVLSYLLVAAGLLLLLFGQQVFKEVRFPLFFMAAMIPLPEAVYSQVADWMRLASTWGAVSLLGLVDIPLHRNGYDINLPNIDLVVGEGCSGIRYLLSYLAFSFAYAFRFKETGKARALVVMAALPLSVMGGMLRLSVVFSTAYYIGPVMTEQRPHEVLSWSVFAVLLVAAIGVDRHLATGRLKGFGRKGFGERISLGQSSL